MKDDGVIAALVLLTIAVVWAGYELYKLNQAIQPIANSPLVRAVSNLGTGAAAL